MKAMVWVCTLSDGVAVFTRGQTGLMYEASVGGQKFSFQPIPTP